MGPSSVLLVEDDDRVRGLLRAFLEDDYEILEAREPGRAGRAAVDTRRPNRIVEVAVCVRIAADDRRPAVLIVNMRR